MTKPLPGPTNREHRKLIGVETSLRVRATVSTVWRPVLQASEKDCLMCYPSNKVIKSDTKKSKVVPNLPKGRVRGGMDTCTRTRTLVFQQGRIRYQGILPRAYRTYQSVGVRVGMDVRTYERVGYGFVNGCTAGIAWMYMCIIMCVCVGARALQK